LASSKRYLWEYGQTADGNYIGKTGDKLGFYGVTPVVQQATAAAATDTATLIVLTTALKTALTNLGLTN
jgi:hypothetical protein